MTEDYPDKLRRFRSLMIVEALQKRDDLKAVQRVKSFRAMIAWDNLEELMIDSRVWDYAVRKMRYQPTHVFCHPQTLIQHPETSLYYRGLCALSLKDAKGLVGSVDRLEAGNLSKAISPDRALKIARVYNTYICSVILKSTAWTLENGYRTITASLGITFDGKMRNVVGNFAERRVRAMILEYLVNNGLIASPKLSISQVLSGDFRPKFELKTGATMQFGSEPDIAFFRKELLVCMIEVKGGTDPAGALERYGAAKKSCEEAIRHNPHCKNFYIGGVFTPELKKRIQRDRLVEFTYSIIDLLEQEKVRSGFFDELFHHVLRIV